MEAPAEMLIYATTLDLTMPAASMLTHGWTDSAVLQRFPVSLRKYINESKDILVE